MLQWRESAVCVRISPASWTSLPPTTHPAAPGHHRAPSQAPCHVPASHWLSALYVVVHVRLCCPPGSSHPPPLTPLCPAVHHLIFSTPPMSSLYLRKFRIAERGGFTSKDIGRWCGLYRENLARETRSQHCSDHSQTLNVAEAVHLKLLFFNLPFREHK